MPTLKKRNSCSTSKKTIDANGDAIYHLRHQSTPLKAIPRSPFQ